MEKPLAGKHILVIEDETVFRSVIAGFLGSLGATVHQAGSIRAAKNPDSRAYLVRSGYAEDGRDRIR